MSAPKQNPKETISSSPEKDPKFIPDLHTFEDFDKLASDQWKLGIEAGKQEITDTDNDDTTDVKFEWLDSEEPKIEWNEKIQKQIEQMDEMAWNLVIALGRLAKKKDVEITKANPSISSEAYIAELTAYIQSFTDPQKIPILESSSENTDEALQHTEAEKLAIHNLQLAFGEQSNTLAGQFLKKHWPSFIEGMVQPAILQASHISQQTPSEEFSTAGTSEEVQGVATEEEGEKPEGFWANLADIGGTLFEKVKNNPGKAILFGLGAWLIYDIFLDKSEGSAKKKIMSGLGMAAITGGIIWALTGDKTKFKEFITKNSQKLQAALSDGVIAGLRIPDWAKGFLKEGLKNPIDTIEGKYDDWKKSTIEGIRTNKIIPDSVANWLEKIDFGDFAKMSGVAGIGGVTFGVMLNGFFRRKVLSFLLTGATAPFTAGKMLLTAPFQHPVFTVFLGLGAYFGVKNHQELQELFQSALKEGGFLNQVQEVAGDAIEGVGGFLGVLGMGSETLSTPESKEEMIQKLQSLRSKVEKHAVSGKSESIKEHNVALRKKLLEKIDAAITSLQTNNPQIDFRPMYWITKKIGLPNTKIQEIGTGENTKNKLWLAGIEFPLLQENDPDASSLEVMNLSIKTYFLENWAEVNNSWQTFAGFIEPKLTIDIAAMSEEVMTKTQDLIQDKDFKTLGVKGLVGLTSVLALVGILKYSKNKVCHRLFQFLTSPAGNTASMASFAWWMLKDGDLDEPAFKRLKDALGATGKFLGDMLPEMDGGMSSKISEKLEGFQVLLGLREAEYKFADSQEKEGLTTAMQELQEFIQENPKIPEDRKDWFAEEIHALNTMLSREQNTFYLSHLTQILMVLDAQKGISVTPADGEEGRFILSIQAEGTQIEFPAMQENPYPFERTAREQGEIMGEFLLDGLENVFHRCSAYIQEAETKNEKIDLQGADDSTLKKVKKLHEWLQKHIVLVQMEGYFRFTKEKEEELQSVIHSIPGIHMEETGVIEWKITFIDSQGGDKGFHILRAGKTFDDFLEEKQGLDANAGYDYITETLSEYSDSFYMVAVEDVLNTVQDDTDLYRIAMLLKANIEGGKDIENLKKQFLLLLLTSAEYKLVSWNGAWVLTKEGGAAATTTARMIYIDPFSAAGREITEITSAAFGGKGDPSWERFQRESRIIPLSLTFGGGAAGITLLSTRSIKLSAQAFAKGALMPIQAWTTPVLRGSRIAQDWKTWRRMKFAGGIERFYEVNNWAWRTKTLTPEQAIKRSIRYMREIQYWSAGGDSARGYMGSRLRVEKLHHQLEEVAGVLKKMLGDTNLEGNRKMLQDATKKIMPRAENVLEFLDDTDDVDVEKFIKMLANNDEIYTSIQSPKFVWKRWSDIFEVSTIGTKKTTKLLKKVVGAGTEIVGERVNATKTHFASEIASRKQNINATRTGKLATSLKSLGYGMQGLGFIAGGADMYAQIQRGVQHQSQRKMAYWRAAGSGLEMAMEGAVLTMGIKGLTIGTAERMSFVATPLIEITKNFVDATQDVMDMWEKKAENYAREDRGALIHKWITLPHDVLPNEGKAYVFMTMIGSIMGDDMDYANTIMDIKVAAREEIVSAIFLKDFAGIEDASLRKSYCALAMEYARTQNLGSVGTGEEAEEIIEKATTFAQQSLILQGIRTLLFQELFEPFKEDKNFWDILDEKAKKMRLRTFVPLSEKEKKSLHQAGYTDYVYHYENTLDELDIGFTSITRAEKEDLFHTNANIVFWNTARQIEKQREQDAETLKASPYYSAWEKLQRKGDTHFLQALFAKASYMSHGESFEDREFQYFYIGFAKFMHAQKIELLPLSEQEISITEQQMLQWVKNPEQTPSPETFETPNKILTDEEISQKFRMGKTPLEQGLMEVAKFLGYEGPAKISSLKDFFSEKNKSAYGIYWNGGRWVVNEQGLEFDNTIQNEQDGAILLAIIKNFTLQRGNVLEFEHDTLLRTTTHANDNRLLEKEKTITKKLMNVYDKHYGNFWGQEKMTREERHEAVEKRDVKERVVAHLQKLNTSEFVVLPPEICANLLSYGVRNSGEFSYCLTAQGEISARKLWFHEKQPPFFVLHVEAAKNDDVAYLGVQNHMQSLFAAQKIDEAQQFLQKLPLNLQIKFLNSKIFLDTELLPQKTEFCILLLMALHKNEQTLQKDSTKFQENRRYIERVQHLVEDSLFSQYKDAAQQKNFEPVIESSDLKFPDVFYTAYLKIPQIMNQLRRLESQYQNALPSSPSARNKRHKYKEQIASLTQEKAKYARIIMEAEKIFFMNFKKAHPTYTGLLSSPLNISDQFDMSQQNYEQAIHATNHWGRKVDYDSPERAIFNDYEYLFEKRENQKNLRRATEKNNTKKHTSDHLPEGVS